MALAAAAACCSACSQQTPAFSQFYDIPSDGWNTLDGKDFAPQSKDSVAPGRYDMVIVVRHNDLFPYTRLWLEMEQADSRGVFATDTVSVAVAGAAGSFLGVGRYGLYEVADTVPVTVTDQWQVSLHHIMTTPDVQGINNLGVVLLNR